jgi:hypothetical protein
MRAMCWTNDLVRLRQLLHHAESDRAGCRAQLGRQQAAAAADGYPWATAGVLVCRHASATLRSYLCDSRPPPLPARNSWVRDPAPRRAPASAGRAVAEPRAPAQVTHALAQTFGLAAPPGLSALGLPAARRRCWPLFGAEAAAGGAALVS